MKKAKRWTSKSQYAAPRDKQHDPSKTDKYQDSLVCSMIGKHRLSEQLG